MKNFEEEFFKKLSKDEYYIKSKIGFYEDEGEKNALNEMSDMISKMIDRRGNYKEGENDYYIERGRKKALEKMYNTISEMKELVHRRFMKESSGYLVDDELVEKGYLYDCCHLYVPFKYKDDEYPDQEIYLAISVLARCYWRDGDLPEVDYCWCQRIGNNFKVLNEFDGLFPIDENYDFTNDLYYYGRQCGLNYNIDSYYEFAEMLKEDILSSPSLDYLKNVDSFRGRTSYHDLNVSPGLFW